MKKKTANEKSIKSVWWLVGYVVMVVILLMVTATLVFRIDPFFHYHKPLISDYYYRISNQRSQNDGIEKNFDYDGIIIGTSMTQNFKTSEAELLWGGSL